MKYTKEQIEEALAAGAKTFTAVYRHISGKPEAKAPGGFAKAVRELIPGVFGTPPSISSDESLETVEPPGYVKDEETKTEKTEKTEKTPAAFPEDECPLCHSGTVGLENGHLVCRGECGNDLGPYSPPTINNNDAGAPISPTDAPTPPPAQPKAEKAFQKWFDPHVCPNCKGKRWRTVNKVEKVYACRSCGTLTPGKVKTFAA